MLVSLRPVRLSTDVCSARNQANSRAHNLIRCLMCSDDAGVVDEVIVAQNEVAFRTVHGCGFLRDGCCLSGSMIDIECGVSNWHEADVRSICT